MKYNRREGKERNIEYGMTTKAPNKARQDLIQLYWEY
jgi:hypothetical protein